MAKLDLSGLSTEIVPDESVKEVTKNVTELGKSLGNNYEAVQQSHDKVKIANVSLKGKYLDNSLSAYQSKMSVVHEIISGAVSVVNNLITAYAEIQKSHDNVRIVQAQAEAYIRGQKEETKREMLRQENETKRKLAELKANLEIKEKELQEFALEMQDRKEERFINHQHFMEQIAPIKKYISALVERQQEVWEVFKNFGFENENLRIVLKQNDESIKIYLKYIKEL